MKKRPATRLEREHMGRVAALGCIVCEDLGYPGSPACVHHIHKQGLSIRANHFDTIPLCPTHHQNGGFGVAIHAGRKTWESIYGTEEELLARVKERLGLTK